MDISDAAISKVLKATNNKFEQINIERSYLILSTDPAKQANNRDRFLYLPNSNLWGLLQDTYNLGNLVKHIINSPFKKYVPAPIDEVEEVIEVEDRRTPDGGIFQPFKNYGSK